MKLLWIRYDPQKILGVFWVPPATCRPLFFAFNPKRLSYNFITGTYNNSVELIESFNYIMYEGLNDGLDHSNDILTEEDMRKRGLL